MTACVIGVVSEYSLLASKFDPLADIPLRVWQQEWAPGKAASVDAFKRLLGELGPPPK